MRELRTRVSLILAVLLGVLLVVGACGDDDDGGGGGGDDAGQDTGGGGDTGVADTGGGGDTGVADTGGGGDDTGAEETGAGDALQDVGGGGEIGITSACTEYNQADVEWPATKTDGDEVRIVIEGVDFARSAVTIRNITSSQLVLTDNWGICHQDVDSSGTCVTRISNGFPIAAGAQVTIHLYREAGMDQPPNDENNIYAWHIGDGLSAERGEVGFRDNASGSTAAENMEAFVRWGSDPTGTSTSARDEAAEAGLWQGNEAGDFVVTSAGDPGLIATGDVTTVAGWSIASANCFPSD